MSSLRTYENQQNNSTWREQNGSGVAKKASPQNTVHILDLFVSSLEESRSRSLSLFDIIQNFCSEEISISPEYLSKIKVLKENYMKIVCQQKNNLEKLNS